MRIAAVAVSLALITIAAAAAPARAAPPPTGPHPRMLLGDRADGRELRAAWHEQATKAHGPVVGAIALCEDAGTSKEHDRAVYQGEEWSKVLQACLVAYAATDKDAYATTAIRFMTALLDDADDIGDHKGGDDTALRDSGYSIRNLGAPTAFAYDWLYAKLTPDQRAHARARWAAWLAKYAEKGYRAHAPASNYHAGYVIASTTMAIAEAGEAGPEGDAQWTRVADQVWGVEMRGALAPDGALAGGDWFEGWQYAPLSVAEYALGARLMKTAGVDVPGVGDWLDSVLRRHVYALSPSDQTFANGDTEAETANIKPYVMTLDGVVLGDSPPDDKRWARGELQRLQLSDKNYLLYDALAAVGPEPQPPPRDKWPTWYLAANTQTLYARTRWDDRAVWFVATCAPEFDMDHRHHDAGSFVLSRGKDDVIVDPSPYGSFSSLTSNAPTVRSAQLPSDMLPSQAGYGGSEWVYTAQTASGVVAARCDYANQYKFHEKASDVPVALRDLVMLPSADGTAATVVVVDRASTTAKDRDMYLRFRTTGKLALDGVNASATIGGSKLAIAGISRSSGTPAIGGTTMKDCEHDTTRGACEAARFPITDYRVELAGPEPRAVHAISATDAAGSAAIATAISGSDWAGVKIAGTRDAVVVWPTDPEAKSLAYTAPRGPKVTHVVLDAPQIDDRATVTAKLAGDGCAVQIAPGGTIGTRPLVVTLGDKCAVAADPAAPSAPSAAHTRAPRAAARSPRAGCCDAGGDPSGPLAIAATLAAMFARGAWPSRRRRSSSARARS